MDDLLKALGDQIVDPEEETFNLFSQPIPSRDLGFVDAKATVLDLTVAGRDVSIHQSPSVLTSSRKEGTTVLWKVTPLFAEWISNPQGLLLRTGCLRQSSTVVELGCGVSGVVSLMLAPLVCRYIATDQDYVLKLLRKNVEENVLPGLDNENRRARGKLSSNTKAKLLRNTGHAGTNIYPLVLDWEVHSASNISSMLGLDAEEGVDAVLACDCIYNEALIEPLVSTSAGICRLRAPSKAREPTLCIVAQQLRSPDVFDCWIRQFHRHFSMYRVPDRLMTKEFGANSGFVIHIGILREQMREESE